MAELLQNTLNELAKHGAEIIEEQLSSAAPDGGSFEALNVTATVGNIEVKLFLAPPDGKGKHVGLFADLRVDGQIVAARGGGLITQKEATDSMSMFLCKLRRELQKDVDTPCAA